MITSYYTKEELEKLGFKSIGSDVRISRKASFYNISEISIGSNIRIDDFCILCGKIEIGNYVHIAPYTALTGGKEGIFIKDFVNISRKIEIFSVSDDYSGETMTSPLVPEKYKNLTQGKVIVNKHVIIGPSCVILPGVTIEEGCAIGALSLIKETTKPWKIYAGIPAKPIKDRSKKLLELEKQFIKETNQ